MAILDKIKNKLGIYYSEANKDAEITDIINGAKAFLESAGWPAADLAENTEKPLAIEAISIYAKMAINTDPAEMRMNPVLLSMIAQARITVSGEGNNEETGEDNDE